MARRRTGSHAKAGRRAVILRVLAILLLLAAASTATIPAVLVNMNKTQDGNLIRDHAAMVAGQPDQDTRAELDAARDYNRRLAADPARTIGDVTDPWGGTTQKDDDGYDHQLDTPADGIMATVSYPRLGIDLPVRHYTTPEVLSDGAGHLHGTSLPVGGTDTHTVISAHSGLADRTMFDRLSMREGRIGDVFVIHTLGQAYAYKVTSIRVVDPADLSGLAIQPGRDLATLLTCTPYGVNNKRLLVTGERTSIHPVPKEGGTGERSGPDWRPILWALAVWAAATGTIAAHALHGRRKARREGTKKKEGNDDNHTVGGEGPMARTDSPSRPRRPRHGRHVGSGSVHVDDSRQGGRPGRRRTGHPGRPDPAMGRADA